VDAFAGRCLQQVVPDIHMNPEEAVQGASGRQRPTSGADSTGARSGWRRTRGPNPIERLLAAADASHVSVAVATAQASASTLRPLHN